MKIKNITKKIASIMIIFALVFSIFGISNNGIKVQASTDKVKMYYFEPTFSKYGITNYSVYIQVNDNAQNKAVYLHYKLDYGSNITWEDEAASYVTTLSDGSQIWQANVNSMSIEYAIKYVGDGQTYWDNNNNNNYTSTDKIGSIPVKLQRLEFQSSDNFKVDVVLKNLAYNKVVKVRYTQDNWATYQDASLSYVSSDTSRGTEEWSTTLSLNTIDQDNFEYCVYYTVNGQTYWDNNFGNNYNSSYYIHH